MNILKNIIGQKLQNNYGRNNAKNWSPSLFDWLKWNTDASRINSMHATTISLVYKDYLGQI